jgi:ADP-heptose:LPS heptosyltransferase
MGLGGYLLWTAVAREVYKKYDKISLPYENHGQHNVMVQSAVFQNNPHIFQEDPAGKEDVLFPLQLNNKETNYCKQDTPVRAFHRYDKHMIAQACEYYDIQEPEIKCEIYFSEDEEKLAKATADTLEKDFILIEPHSKTNYTPNRAYPYDKWQKVVDDLSKDYQVVQVGTAGTRLLDNVIDLTGKTSFRIASKLLEYSKLFLSSEGGLAHAATAVNSNALIILTGYQSPNMVCYPQNYYINTASHGPCGLKIKCPECDEDASVHNEGEIIEKARSLLK